MIVEENQENKSLGEERHLILKYSMPYIVKFVCFYKNWLKLSE